MKNILPKIQLLLAMLFFGGCLFAFFYLYKESVTNKEIVTLLERDLAVENYAKEEVKTTGDFIKSIDRERTQLESHFISSSDVVPFLDWLESSATGVGVKSEVSSVDINKEEPALLVEAGAIGSFGVIYKFLTVLENSPYEMEITSLSMTRTTSLDSGGVEVPEWRAKFNIKLLSFTL